jgi:hypothetical protein
MLINIFSGQARALRLDKMILSLKQFFRNFALVVAVKVESRKKRRLAEAGPRRISFLASRLERRTVEGGAS